MYLFFCDATFSAIQRADILSSIFSPFMLWWCQPLQEQLSSKLGNIELVQGRKMK